MITIRKLIYEFQKENRPRKITLEVSIGDFSNNWDLWIYPSSVPDYSDKILVADKLDKKTIEALEKGAKVLLSTKKGTIKDGYGGEVGIGFSRISGILPGQTGQKPYTLGILCDPHHPALEQFPSE